MKESPRTTGLFIAGALFVVYIAVGYVWAAKTAALIEPDVLFHADTPRVVWNETFTRHAPGRTVLHPLHVLMTVPFGVPLTALFGSRNLAAVLISAAFAAGTVYSFHVLLRRGTALPSFERMSFLLLFGLSAGHATFASVPETHVISGFFLSLVACHFANRNLEVTGVLPERAGDWVKVLHRAGVIPIVFAAGALVTNLVLVPVCGLLTFSRDLSRVRRLGAVAVVTAATVSVLVVLYVGQRAIMFGSAPPNAGPHPPVATSAAHLTPKEPAVSAVAAPADAPVLAAAATPSPSAAPKRRGLGGWFNERFERELRYVSLSPRRLAEVSLAVLLYNLYAPRVVKYLLPPNPEGYAVSKLTAVRFDSFAFDLRPIAVVGGVAWSAVLALALIALSKRGEPRKLLAPAFVFAAAWLLLYVVVFALYHVYPIGPESNDIFLFAPNLILPLLYLVAATYSHGMTATTVQFNRCVRAALAIAVVTAAVNTGLHTFDLLSYYVATPVPS